MGIPKVKDPILEEYNLKDIEKIYIDTLKILNQLQKKINISVLGISR